MSRKPKKRVTMRPHMPSVRAVTKALGVDESGAVQQYVTDQVFENLKDFMPEKTGKLKANAWKPFPDLIRVNGIQARFLFFGLRKDGTPVNYSRDKNPNAGPNWDKRMMAERKDMITANVRRYARKRGK